MASPSNTSPSASTSAASRTLMPVLPTAARRFEGSLSWRHSKFETSPERRDVSRVRCPGDTFRGLVSSLGVAVDDDGGAGEEGVADATGELAAGVRGVAGLARERRR